jgi:hypothetical protein
MDDQHRTSSKSVPLNTRMPSANLGVGTAPDLRFVDSGCVGPYDDIRVLDWFAVLASRDEKMTICLAKKLTNVDCAL